jgi:hypothetical protein
MFVRPFAIGPPLAIINDSFRGGKLSHTSQQIRQVPYFKVSVPQVSRGFIWYAEQLSGEAKTSLEFRDSRQQNSPFPLLALEACVPSITS